MVCSRMARIEAWSSLSMLMEDREAYFKGSMRMEIGQMELDSRVYIEGPAWDV